MTAYRRWSLTVLGGLLFFIGGNFALWVTKTGKLFLPAPSHGDLARVAYLPSLATPRHEISTLPRRQLRFEDVKPGLVEVVTVGDSISRGRGCGVNNFYQDHIASIHCRTTLHLVEMLDADFLEAMIIHHNSGMFRKLGAKHVILQSAERHAIDRYTRDVDWSSTRPLEKLWRYYQDNQTHHSIASINRQAFKRQQILEASTWSRACAYAKQFIFMHVDNDKLGQFQKRFERRFGYVPFQDDPIVSDGLITSMPKAMNANLKYLVYKLYYRFDMREQQSIANLYELDRPLFAEADGQKFLAHIGDLRNQVLAEREGIMEKMHANFNRLADLLAEDGIQLHVMISPNKLTVYQPYLKDKSVPPSVFFDRMRSFTDRRYEFIDTEKVIAELIARNERDVYFAGDSHWSGKPLEGIVRSIRFEDRVAKGSHETMTR